MNAVVFDVEIDHLVLDVLPIDPARAGDLRRLIARKLESLLEADTVVPERRISGPQLDDVVRVRIPAIDPGRSDDDIAREVAEIIVAAIRRTAD